MGKHIKAILGIFCRVAILSIVFLCHARPAHTGCTPPDGISLPHAGDVFSLSRYESDGSRGDWLGIRISKTQEKDVFIADDESAGSGAVGSRFSLDDSEDPADFESKALSVSCSIAHLAREENAGWGYIGGSLTGNGEFTTTTITPGRGSDAMSDIYITGRFDVFAGYTKGLAKDFFVDARVGYARPLFEKSMPVGRDSTEDAGKSCPRDQAYVQVQAALNF